MFITDLCSKKFLLQYINFVGDPIIENPLFDLSLIQSETIEFN